MWPQPGTPGATRARKGQKGPFPRAPRGNAALLTPGFGASGLQDCGRVNFCSSKSPGLWPLVTAALGTDTRSTGHQGRVHGHEPAGE